MKYLFLNQVYGAIKIDEIKYFEARKESFVFYLGEDSVIYTSDVPLETKFEIIKEIIKLSNNPMVAYVDFEKIIDEIKEKV
jgi:predicted TIM-barrel fold metal-dependent hydrolase